MEVTETALPGVLILKGKPIYDERGFFARMFCNKTFAELGLCSNFDFDTVSFNTHKHTLRGMHFQVAPNEETKLVRCVKGRIFDVVVDLRPDSNSYGKWISVELDESELNAIYIPPMCAHGFITLAANSQVEYKMKGQYDLASARGCRYDDPGLAIKWPAEPTVISGRDKEFGWLFGKT